MSDIAAKDVGMIITAMSPFRFCSTLESVVNSCLLNTLVNAVNERVSDGYYG